MAINTLFTCRTKFFKALNQQIIPDVIRGRVSWAAIRNRTVMTAKYAATVPVGDMEAEIQHHINRMRIEARQIAEQRYGWPPGSWTERIVETTYASQDGRSWDIILERQPVEAAVKTLLGLSS